MPDQWGLSQRPAGAMMVQEGNKPMEVRMRTVFTPAVSAATLFLTSFLAAAPAMAAPNMCIDTRDIVSSEAKDGGAALLFKMKNGTQWLNTLQGKCPDLIFNGYVWTIRNPDNTVCEREESLRVLQSGQICVLGKFTKVAPAPSRG
jgi:hypothetical protein